MDEEGINYFVENKILTPTLSEGEGAETGKT
jgi:hypothetical protein